MEHRYVTESWTAVKKSRVKVYEFVKNDFLIKPLKISNQIATLCKIGGKYIVEIHNLGDRDKESLLPALWLLRLQITITFY
jgi:hypothetical protein